MVLRGSASRGGGRRPRSRRWRGSARCRAPSPPRRHPERHPHAPVGRPRVVSRAPARSRALRGPGDPLELEGRFPPAHARAAVGGQRLPAEGSAERTDPGEGEGGPAAACSSGRQPSRRRGSPRSRGGARHRPLAPRRRLRATRRPHHRARRLEPLRARPPWGQRRGHHAHGHGRVVRPGTAGLHPAPRGLGWPLRHRGRRGCGPPELEGAARGHGQRSGG